MSSAAHQLHDVQASPERVEVLFERYRAAGDAAAMAAVFDATCEELYGLALHLVRDPSRADDLVQETYITAIERASSWDAERPLVPWLVGILSMSAKRERRRGARGLDEARLERREVATPVHTALDSEAHSLVHAACAQLPETYRAVLELHLTHGKRPMEIADELSRAPGTVRVQLHRGLEMLRAALPASLAMGTLAALAPRGRAAVRAAVEEHALRAAARASVQATAAVSPFALVLQIALALALVSGLVMAVAWWAEPAAREPASSLGAPARALAELAPKSAAHPLQAERGEHARTSAAPAPLGPASSAAALAPSAPGVWLALQLVGFESAEPSALGVRLRSAGSPLGAEQDSVFAAGRDAGTLDQPAHESEGARLWIALTPWFEPGGAAPREFFVSLDHPAYAPQRERVLLSESEHAAARAWRAGERVELGLQSRPSTQMQRTHGVLRARVLAPLSTAPITAGLYWLGSGANPELEPLEALNLGADGALRLRSARAGTHVLVLACEPLRPLTRRIELSGGEVDLGMLLMDQGASLSGSVRDAAGMPAPHAALMLAPLARTDAEPTSTHTYSLSGVPLGWTGTSFERTLGALACDDAGRFEIHGLARGTFRIWARSSPSASAPRVSTRAGLLGTEATAQRSNATQHANIVHAPATGLVLVVDADPADERVQAAQATELAEPDPHAELAQLSIDTLGAADERWLLIAAPRALFDAHARPPTPSELRRHAATRAEACDARGAAQLMLPAGAWFVALFERPLAAGELAHAVAPPAVQALDLAPGARVHQLMSLTRGGRLHLSAALYTGPDEQLTLEARDHTGTRVPVRVVVSWLRADERGGRSVLDDALPVRTSATSCALAPGTYQLTARDTQGWSARAEVVVEAGRDTDVQLLPSAN